MLIASCAGIQNSYYYAIGDALQVTEHEVELLDAYVRNDIDLFTLVEQLGVKVGEHRTPQQEQGEEGGAGTIEGTDEATPDHSPQDESV